MMLPEIDVGMGTMDILLYDSQKNIENCFKMVMPSHTRIITYDAWINGCLSSLLHSARRIGMRKEERK